MNREAFWKMERADVGADEVFFHKYFSAVGGKREKIKNKKEKARRKKGEGSDEGDEEEEEIWKALVGSRPEIEGDGEDDVSEEDDMDLEAMAEEMDSDVDTQDNANNATPPDDDDDDEIPTFHDHSEDEGIRASDDDLPSDIDVIFEKEETKAGQKAEEKSSKKDNKKAGGGRKEKRRKLKHLPTFADADDYARMMDGDGDEETGMGGVG